MPVFDLHMHTSASDDGEYSVEQLLNLCRRAGLSHIAITDHNTVKAVPEALMVAPKFGLEIISGIELDAQLNGHGFHILGYGIDYADPRFTRVEQDIIGQEVSAAQRKLDVFEEISGLRVEIEEIEAISGTRQVTGELVAEVLLNRLDASGCDILQPYMRGGARSDNPYVNFYWDFFSQGKPAYVEIEYISVAQAIELIHNAGGMAVLAHPGQNLGHDESLLAQVLAQGMDGVEVYSSYHDERDIEFFKAHLGDRLLTCGSDFHGKTKPAIKLKPILQEGDALAKGMEILFG